VQYSLLGSLSCLVQSPPNPRPLWPVLTLSPLPFSPNLPQVFLRMYEGWAHTDPILEGPLIGDNTLCIDIMTQIKKTFPPSPPPPPLASVPAAPSTEFSASTSASSAQPSALSAADSGIQNGFTASSLISSAFPTPSSLRPRPLLIPQALSMSRSDSQSNSEEGSSIRNTSSVSTDDLFSAAIQDNKPNGKLVKKVPKNSRKNSSEKSTMNGARTMNSPVSVSTVCPRCALRFRLAATKSVIDRIQSYQNVDDSLECVEGEDCDGSDVAFRNTGGECGKEVIFSEYFPSKSGVNYVSAVPVPVPVPATVDQMCCGGRLVRKHRGENHCKCVISDIPEADKKGSSTVPIDDFKDCRVPRFFVGIARWVNPF
jgi:hypothetical protein